MHGACWPGSWVGLRPPRRGADAPRAFPQTLGAGMLGDGRQCRWAAFVTSEGAAPRGERQPGDSTSERRRAAVADAVHVESHVAQHRRRQCGRERGGALVADAVGVQPEQGERRVCVQRRRERRRARVAQRVAAEVEVGERSPRACTCMQCVCSACSACAMPLVHIARAYRIVHIAS